MQMLSVWGGKKSLLSTASESAVSRDSHFPGTLYANGKVPWRCIMLCGLINSMRKTVGPGRVRISSLSRLATAASQQRTQQRAGRAVGGPVPRLSSPPLRLPVETTKSANMAENVSFQWDGRNLAAHPRSAFCSHSRCCTTSPSVLAPSLDCRFLLVLQTSFSV